MTATALPTLGVDGFEEVTIAAGPGAANSAMCTTHMCSHDCSRDCSRHCSTKCSLDETFAPSADAWERFIALEGGNIQF